MSFEEFLSQVYGISSQEEIEQARQSGKLAAYFSEYQRAKSTGDLANYMQQGYKSGQYGNAMDFQGTLASNGIQTTPEFTQWLNNEVSQQVVGEERDYNTQMRDSSLTSAASQLSSLGLNPGSVISTGGAGIGNTGAVADTSKGNPALEKAMTQFQAKAAMTRTLVGLVGGLASAGVYGSTRLLAQKAASVAAASAANSGLSVISRSKPTKYDGMSWDQLLKHL